MRFNKNALVILGLLSEKRLHGYDIIREVKLRGYDHWANVNIASIYNNLARLEKQRAIRARTERRGNMPERRVYAVTAAGRKILARQVIAAMQSPAVIEDLVSLGITFIYGAGRRDVLRALEARCALFGMVKGRIHKHYRDNVKTLPYNWQFLLCKTLRHFEIEIKYFSTLIEAARKKDFFRKKRCVFKLKPARRGGKK